MSFLKHNLYVRNFPENTSEPELFDYFAQFGELHNVKIMKEAGQSENGERSKGFGFVCFKHPDGAKKAHQHAPQTPLNGRTLYVNYAEKKEIRLIRKEEENDKRDFDNYRMQNMMNSGPMNAGDPMSMNMMMPMFFQMFQQQMRNFFMQQQRGQMPQARNMRGGHMQRGGGMHRGGRGGYNNQGGYNNNMRNHHQQMPQAPPMGGNFAGGHPGQQQQQMIMQQQPVQQPPMQQQPMAQTMPTQGAPGFVDPSMMQQQVPQQPAQVNMDAAFQAHVILPIQQQNVFATGDEDTIKEAVGEAIYQFVEQITGEEDAPKVTGMLIDLPIQDLESLISNYANFSIKVNEGLHLLKQQEAAAQ